MLHFITMFDGASEKKKKKSDSTRHKRAVEQAFKDQNTKTKPTVMVIIHGGTFILRQTETCPTLVS